jgi:hypothetical protein
MISMGTIQGSFQEGGHVGPSSGRKLVAMPTLTGRKAPAVNSPPATKQPSAGIAEFVEEWRALAQQFEEQAGRSHEILYWALAKILQLDILIGQSADNRTAYMRILAQR